MMNLPHDVQKTIFEKASIADLGNVMASHPECQRMVQEIMACPLYRPVLQAPACPPTTPRVFTARKRATIERLYQTFYEEAPAYLQPHLPTGEDLKTISEMCTDSIYAVFVREGGPYGSRGIRISCQSGLYRIHMHWGPERMEGFGIQSEEGTHKVRCFYASTPAEEGLPATAEFFNGPGLSPDQALDFDTRRKEGWFAVYLWISTLFFALHCTHTEHEEVWDAFYLRTLSVLVGRDPSTVISLADILFAEDHAEHLGSQKTWAEWKKALDVHEFPPELSSSLADSADDLDVTPLLLEDEED